MSILPDRERVVKCIRPRRNECINIPILGHRDPRGPDNHVRVWVDKQDKLHIRVEKINRCYQYERTLLEEGFIEIIAS